MRIFYSFFEIMLHNKLNIISQTKHSFKNKTDIDFNYNKFNYNVTPSTKIYFYSSHFPYPPFYSHDFTFENYKKCSDDINISIIDLPKTHSALEGASSPETFVFKFNKQVYIK